MSEKTIRKLLSRIDVNDEHQKIVHYFHRDRENDVDLYYTHDRYGFDYVLPKSVNYSKQREKLRQRREHLKKLEEYGRLLSIEYMKSFSRMNSNEMLGMDNSFLLSKSPIGV
jgi:hypothetical protein